MLSYVVTLCKHVPVKRSPGVGKAIMSIIIIIIIMTNNSTNIHDHTITITIVSVIIRRSAAHHPIIIHSRAPVAGRRPRPPRSPPGRTRWRRAYVYVYIYIYY